MSYQFNNFTVHGDNFDATDSGCVIGNYADYINIADLESQVADHEKDQRTVNKTRAESKTGRRFIKD